MKLFVSRQIAGWAPRPAHAPRSAKSQSYWKMPKENLRNDGTCPEALRRYYREDECRTMWGLWLVNLLDVHDVWETHVPAQQTELEWCLVCIFVPQWKVLRVVKEWLSWCAWKGLGEWREKEEGWYQTGIGKLEASYWGCHGETRTLHHTAKCTGCAWRECNDQWEHVILLGIVSLLKD